VLKNRNHLPRNSLRNKGPEEQKNTQVRPIQHRADRAHHLSGKDRDGDHSCRHRRGTHPGRNKNIEALDQNEKHVLQVMFLFICFLPVYFQTSMKRVPLEGLHQPTTEPGKKKC
jgi:hypothetical protein